MIPDIQILAQKLTGLCEPSPAPVQPPPVDASGTPATAAVPPPAPVQITDYAAKGYHLDATVGPGKVVAAAQILLEQGFGMDTITGVDWMAAGQMEVVYDYFHPLTNLHVVVRSRIPRATPVIPTISKVFPGANWHERETHDFFGIEFEGHPDLSPFLLPEDATYHPLRKDYQP
jgi:NADH-quinone oxidoreductase subunit C